MGAIVSLLSNLGNILHIIVKVLCILFVFFLVGAVIAVLVIVPCCIFHRKIHKVNSTYAGATAIASANGARGNADDYLAAEKKKESDAKREKAEKAAKVALL